MTESLGFFTDSSICIGCKACEVACKEWNHVPEDGLKWLASSYDNSGELGCDTWRHVAFIEQKRNGGASPGGDVRWLMNSDVCKHCHEAACLEVCPTGALFRTEFNTVVVQEDVCNGCGYCVPACPFGVIERREQDGKAWKCTLCYDRLKIGQQPACAKACPTESISFGTQEEMKRKAARRLGELREAGVSEARLYGTEEDSGVGGTGSIFLLLDEPEQYRLPSKPVTPTRNLRETYGATAVAALAMAAGIAFSFLGASKR